MEAKTRAKSREQQTGAESEGLLCQRVLVSNSLPWWDRDFFSWPVSPPINLGGAALEGRDGDRGPLVTWDQCGQKGWVQGQGFEPRLSDSVFPLTSEPDPEPERECGAP